MPESAINTLSFSAASFFSSAIWSEIRSVGVPTVLVPSLDDMLAFPCFPQAPYKTPVMPVRVCTDCDA